ncbi:MAG: hypothetical protein GC192_22130 [Bacteroidetes bacterium]|nr:hypothetical protein [Bacteroidota bacterium]
MILPNQSSPIIRGSKSFTYHDNAVNPSGLFCSPCKSIIGAVGNALIGAGCVEAVAAFEVACNAALDLIPIVGEGPSEIACGLGGAALGVACKAAGGTVTKEVITAAQNAVCGYFC